METVALAFQLLAAAGAGDVSLSQFLSPSLSLSAYICMYV